MRLINIDHVGIAVHDLDATLAEYERQYQVRAEYREVNEEQGVEEAMLPVGASNVQLLQPLNPDTPVGRFLAKHGEGLHHIAFAVPSIEQALRHLAEEEVELIDTHARVGGGGHRIAFVHPRALAGTLIELVELQ
jgi:methylmalonyl-CoA/ethylmalonyl-CoA epimerase